MYSEELNELINAALADGHLTQKERAVLHKRAQQEGVDTDELDMLIDGRLVQMRQQAPPIPPSATASTKMGNIMKCPACGAPYVPGTGACPECGHVFTNVAANESIVSLFTRIQEAYDKNGKDSIAVRNEVVTLINNFPIPSDKDSLIEFILTMAARRTGSEDSISDAYNGKLKEAINKSAVLFPKDPQMQSLIKKYTQHSWSNLDSTAKDLIIGVGLWLFALLIILIGLLFQES